MRLWQCLQSVFLYCILKVFKIIEELKKYRKHFYKLFYSLALVLPGCSSDGDLSINILNDKWVSSTTPKSEVWFQNWGDYQRLLMVINSDTMDIVPGPYVTEKEGKPYLKPIPYKKVEKQQLKGNIYWNEPPKWDDGHMNSARWIVDRSNPKISLPRTYNIELAMADGSLKLEVFEDQESYLQLDLIPINSY